MFAPDRNASWCAHLIAASYLAAGTLAAQDAPSDPTLRVAVIPGVPETTVTVQLLSLLTDDRFTNSLASGFPLRVGYRIELWRKRAAWFDDLENSREFDVVVIRDPVTELYVMEFSFLDDVNYLRDDAALAVALADTYNISIPIRRAGSYYALVNVEVNTLDQSDIDEVMDWLRGDENDPQGGGEGNFVTRSARNLLLKFAGFPRRSLNGRSEEFRVEVP